jgi:predicted nucleic acid-binding protein
MHMLTAAKAPKQAISSRLLAGCDSLYSEDLQSGRRFDGQLTVRNPL